MDIQDETLRLSNDLTEKLCHWRDMLAEIGGKEVTRDSMTVQDIVTALQRALYTVDSCLK